MSPPPPLPALRSAMVPRFGPLVWLSGLGWGLSRVRLEDHAAEIVQSAQLRGPVVYLLLRRSNLDHLALNAALQGTGLPLSAWAGALQNRWARPWGQDWSVQSPPDPVRSGALARALQSGQAITLFDVDPTANALLEQLPDGNVQVVPVQIAWNRNPRATTPATRFFSGESDRPGALRRMWRLWRRADVFVQVGEAIDLAQLGERVESERLPKILRRIAARSLYQESRLVRGPRLLPFNEMKRRVLDHPPLRELARQDAEARGVPQRVVDGELSAAYERIAARFSWVTIRFLHVLLRPLWTRVFSGVDVRPEDLERLRTAMRDGSPILVPSHKSHFDYVLMSWVLYDNDMIVPHVVAGINLAVWPISVFLRGAGGFFIERSFTGRRLFPALFSRYLRELVIRDYTVEFFIEGGRSRSGKLLPARLGVLDMVMDAAAVRHTGREVTLLPIAFSYEQVAEERSYAREIRGRRKQPESIGQFIRGTINVLQRRFGRVYLRVGEPIPCGPLVDGSSSSPPWPERTEATRRQELEQLGQRIIHRIGRAQVVLPSSVVAAALMVHHRRAIRHPELMERIQRFTQLLLHLSAPVDPTAVEAGVSPALDRFHATQWIEAHDEADGPRVWSIAIDERLRLEFHKNQLLHHLADAGIAAAALRIVRPGGSSDPVTLPALQEPAERLADVWCREIVLDPDATTAERVRRGLSALVHHGALEADDDTWRLVAPDRAGEVLGAFLGLAESYWATFSYASEVDDRRALARHVHEAIHVHLAEGTLKRPEALSMDTLRNASRWLDRRGWLLQTKADQVRVDVDAVRGHVEVMAKLLGKHT